jgi:hypothetical protein
MTEQNSERIDFDDEIVLRCLKADRARWEAAAARDLRTLDDWIRTRLDAAADRELRDSPE